MNGFLNPPVDSASVGGVDALRLLTSSAMLYRPAYPDELGRAGKLLEGHPINFSMANPH